MKKKVIIFLFLLILGGMTSCDLIVPVVSGQEHQAVSQKYSTVSALLTETAAGPAVQDRTEAIPVRTQVEKEIIQPSAAPQKTITPDISEFSGPTILALNDQSGSVQCDVAQPGHPLDITIPDDTRFYPGQIFSKTWRLVNAGNCTWTTDYAVVWFSGDQLANNRAQSFLTNVASGSSVEVTVDMVTPLRPGTYQSNWKLRNREGQLFGIGPNGDSPFWVRIVVLPEDTPTATLSPATPSPVATATPLVFASGSLILDLDQSADLDSGQDGLTVEDDLAFVQPEDERFFINPENNARFVSFGSNTPGLQDCELAEVSTDPIDLQQVPAGSYLCYRTNQGLPGRIYLSALDLEQSTVDFEFVTWVVP